ncbi:hypothetical protein HPB48_022459 [Haemaphysalis longicornis]|uniref:Peptidase M13 C-terminal domain-containing protein n=1 Tax=Haemaphysalis longicornis TaxID=44386 RepID=A0A9J6G488_HAELO|nr:hypothetical protein HPB48_022459 [Haemaphysalis longicornis]
MPPQRAKPLSSKTQLSPECSTSAQPLSPNAAASPTKASGSSEMAPELKKTPRLPRRQRSSSTNLEKSSHTMDKSARKSLAKSFRQKRMKEPTKVHHTAISGRTLHSPQERKTPKDHFKGHEEPHSPNAPDGLKERMTTKPTGSAEGLTVLKPGERAGHMCIRPWQIILLARQTVRSHAKSLSDADNLSRDQQHREPPPVFRLPLVLVVIVAVCLAVALLFHLLIHGRSRGDEYVRGLCRSPGCLYHAELIARHVNHSVDPCHDFKAFACSKWVDAGDASGYGTALMSRQRTAWFKDFQGFLESGTKLISAGIRPLRMFEQCMSDVDKVSAKKGIRELKAFMQQRKIPWPEPPHAGVEPLGVLLDLAYNWRLGLWFDASALRVAADIESRRPWSLLIEPGTFVGVWVVHNENIIHGGGYTNYWNSLRDAFSDGSPTAHTGPTNIDEVASRETEILWTLFEVTRSSIKKPSRFPIRDIERYTPNISASVWNHEIEKTIVLDEGMSTLQELPNSITVFASLADRKYLVNTYGSQAMAHAHKQEFCATEVEAAYRFLVAALYTMPHFSTEARATIDLQLKSVKEAALDKIASGRPSWTDNSSREFLASKISKLKTLLWPPADYLNESDLQAVFGDLSWNESSFVEHWFDAHYAKRGLLADPRYSAAMTMPLNFELPYFSYDYIFNTVLVSVAALARPLYDASAAASMTYGGLGFSYAFQLVRAFDDGGMVVDADGNITTDSWASPHWKRGSLAKLDCLKPLFDSPFREIPALEIAHSAFRRALGNDSEQSRQVTLNYTEEQVFFITACFTMCTNPKPSGRFFGGDCNKAAMNYAPFSNAFGCRDGARMKPNKQCPYFD